MEPLSTFTSQNLYSKKEWLFPNNVIYYLTFVIPIFIFIFAYPLIQVLLSTKVSLIIKLITLFIAYYITDLISAFIHCYYIDNSFSKKKYNIDNHGNLVINTVVGYASCHHIFPSNWADIKDSTIFITTSLYLIIPLLLIYFCIKNVICKLFGYSILCFSLLTPLSHKYAHEKTHGRYVPPIIDFLINNNILLNPKVHSTHHKENNYNWALFSGISNPFFDFIINNICTIFNKCPTEDRTRNANNYINTMETHNIVNIKFTGDIEGYLQCRLIDNIFVSI